MLYIAKQRICIKPVLYAPYTVGVASCLTTVQYEKITSHCKNFVVDNIIVAKPRQNSMESHYMALKTTHELCVLI